MTHWKVAEMRQFALRIGPILAVLLLSSRFSDSAAADQPDLLPKLDNITSEAVSVEVDAMINAHLSEAGTEPLGPASNEDFLRRISLDLAGTIPTPQQITRFGKTSDDEKRTQTIDRLLESEDFARTWASYWREVIFSRATEMRSRIAQPTFEDWMTEQLHSGQGWDDITTALLTASGNTREEGSTALIFAQGGDPAEIAAEVSRIFLGIQIQCANCHDHPYDKWKRDDFHELAAFFPRIRLRRDGATQPTTFIIESADNERDGQGRPFDVDQLFRFLDRNRDGQLTKTEAQRSRQFGQRFERIIEYGDKNGDRAVSREEMKDLPMPQAQPGRGTAEYYMPDLENPAEPGTRTQPVFFVNDRAVSLGTRDLDRREALAKYITSPFNPWFARAFVNRVWAELLGTGFYSPIDDMGPQRNGDLTEILDILAAGFAANDYNVKWLYRTIVLTDAYQRAAPIEGMSDDLPAYAAAAPTRLRGDQLYNAFTQVLGVSDLGGRKGRGARMGAMRMSAGDYGRFAFGLLFNNDPSIPQVDLMGNIPQALFLMNSPATSLGISGRGTTPLGRILREFESDEDALNELYLRVLSREPSDTELTICQEYIAQFQDRPQPFEDIMWSLMNSTEFLTKR